MSRSGDTHNRARSRPVPALEPSAVFHVELSSAPPRLSDAELVAEIAERRESGLAEVYRQHAGSVFALARRVLRDPERAADVTQEVFLRLWEKPARYDPRRGALYTFLLVETHGRSVDRIRADIRRTGRETKFSCTAVPDSCDLGSEIEAIALGVHVRDALSVLPPDERMAIECAYFGGHTYQEVADILRTPEGTIKSRIRAGLRRLHDQMVDLGIEP